MFSIAMPKSPKQTSPTVIPGRITMGFRVHGSGILHSDAIKHSY
jgi:hypothetical protein